MPALFSSSRKSLSSTRNDATAVIVALWTFKFFSSIVLAREKGFTLDQLKFICAKSKTDPGYFWRMSFSDLLHDIERHLADQKDWVQAENATSKLKRKLFFYIRLIEIFVIRQISKVVPIKFKTRDTLKSQDNKCTFLEYKIRKNAPPLKAFPKNQIAGQESDISKAILTVCKRYSKKFNKDLSWANDSFLLNFVPHVFLASEEREIDLPSWGKNSLLHNFAGDILLSDGWLKLFLFGFQGKVFGCQHGGGYGILDSIYMQAEISCYQEFLYQDLSPVRSTIKKRNC